MKCELDSLGEGREKSKEMKASNFKRKLSFFIIIKASERCDAFWVSLLSQGLRQYVVCYISIAVGRVQLNIIHLL